MVVKYEYDPRGKCTIVSDTSENNLGKLNPFRYRGYYYDEETSLYYLQSRYYDFNTCKFINSDDPSILLVAPDNVQCVHIYDYCNNNPVANVDYSGFKWITKLSQYKAATPAERYQYKIIKGNYSLNRNLFNKYKKSLTYIYYQKDYLIKSMKYGTHYIEKVGCEIVATYNIMAFLKKKPDFAKIILEFELNNMYYFTSTGKYGTDPEDLYKYFNAHNVKYSKYTSRSKFDKNMSSGKNKCGIFSYWNKKKNSYKIYFWNEGLHTVAYKYDSKKKKYYVYNFGNKTTYSKKELTNILDEHRFIIGYTF